MSYFNKDKFKFYMLILCLFCIVNLIGCTITVNKDDTKDIQYEGKIEESTKDANEGTKYQMGDVLPLGTIISLKNDTEKLMIVGWSQVSPEDDDKLIYDYNACEYPKGAFHGKSIHFFNEEDIDKIYSDGYVDDDGVNYRNKVIEYRNNLRGKNDELKEKSEANNNTSNSNMNTKDKLLPLGSVVTVNGKNSKCIIVGRLLKGKDDILHDYYACLYPQGNIKEDYNILFDESDINDISFYGYEDEEEKEYNNLLVKYKKSTEN